MPGDTRDELTATEVGILLLDAVGVLHRRGYEGVRILPGLAHNAPTWRLQVAPSAAQLETSRCFDPQEDRSFRYASGQGSVIGDVSVASATEPEMVADTILRSMPHVAKAADAAYAVWFQRLLEELHAQRSLPVAIREGFDGDEGWELGWRATTRDGTLTRDRADAAKGLFPPPPPATVGDTGFSSYVCEQLGWYVYALRNPIDGRLFYIGKGRGNRVFAHANDALASDDDGELSQKLGLIKSIHAAGRQVEAFIIRHGLASEKLAYEIEASIIDILGLLDNDLDNPYFELTNVMGGHHSSTLGVAGVDVIASLYEAPTAPDITEPVLLIKIPGLWTPSMSPHELYEATRQWWRLGPRRNDARYALSVNHGVIRQVYRIDPGSWKSQTLDGKTRWKFAGSVDDALSAKYRNTSVKHLHKKGQASPVLYFNC